MNNCQCGIEVRLGAMRMAVDRKRGVMHYIAHMERTDCARPKGYTCSMTKPYPKNDADKPWFKMLAQWNEDNPQPAQPAPDAPRERFDDGTKEKQ